MNLHALFKGEASKWDLGKGGVLQPGVTASGASQDRLPTCMGPLTNGGALLFPKERPIGWQGTEGCKELGFNPNAPVYFSYLALHRTGFGKFGTNIKGWTYWNWATHDIDGDGEFTGFVEAIGERDGQLSLARTCPARIFRAGCSTTRSSTACRWRTPTSPTRASWELDSTAPVSRAPS